ncbi:hypothetical protein NDU88_002046 [Pleurodeles waltl]|uniref:Uncharacterized protein n=1 Tax=Pleurodeles waltl TaxID=8319 RepID=A0AAV7Q5L4_PLEWA|nr:hypothetical protein NDU88_002046 [Pleurodeles waltl]
MGQYTTPVVLPQRAARLEVSGYAAGMALNSEEPSRAELLVVIQGSWVALEGKIETVAVEVNLLQPDLQKVSVNARDHTFSIAQRRCGDGWRCGTRWLREERRDLEASPDGLLERKARTGDHMALVGWRIRVTGWRYTEMEQ